MAEGDSQAPPNQPRDKVFRYLDLPAELQLRIIAFAVIEPDIIDITRSERGTCAQPAMTRVSVGVRGDALSCYYKDNSFAASYCRGQFDHTKEWLSSIGAGNRGKMRNLLLYDLGYDEEGDSYEMGANICMAEACYSLTSLGAELVKKNPTRYTVKFSAQ